MPVEQLPPPSGLPSSTMPSQSLSTPSHDSLPATPSCMHTSRPPSHAVTPSPHGPGMPVEQSAPPTSLSISRSQSLSMPSQISSDGTQLAPSFGPPSDEPTPSSPPSSLIGLELAPSVIAPSSAPSPSSPSSPPSSSPSVPPAGPAPVPKLALPLENP